MLTNTFRFTSYFQSIKQIMWKAAISFELVWLSADQVAILNIKSHFAFVSCCVLQSTSKIITDIILIKYGHKWEKKAPKLLRFLQFERGVENSTFAGLYFVCVNLSPLSRSLSFVIQFENIDNIFNLMITYVFTLNIFFQVFLFSLFIILRLHSTQLYL